MHVVQGPPGKQPLAKGVCPVEIEVNNNAYELIRGYALNITRSWHNQCMDTFL